MKDGDFLSIPEMQNELIKVMRGKGYKQTLDAAHQLEMNIINNARKNADQPIVYELPEYTPEGGDNGSGAGGNRANDLSQLDAMFEEVARFVVQNQQGSTSSIQRRFSIGYNRAGRIMDQLEMAGVVGRAEGSKPREVLIQDMLSLEHLLSNLD